MRNLLCFGLALVVVCGFSGCGASGPEGTVQEMISTMDEISSILEGIKDNSSADSAIPKLKAAAEKIKTLGKKMEDYKLSKEEDKKLKEKYETKIKDAIGRMLKASVSAGMSAPGKAKDIQDAMKKAGPGGF